MAAVAGTISFLLLWRQPHPKHSSSSPEFSVRYLFQPLRDFRFRRLVSFNLCWLLGLNVCTPLMNAHLRKNLHWDFRHLALLSVLNSLVAILINPFWGRLADRHGHKPVLKLCSLGMLHLPLY